MTKSKETGEILQAVYEKMSKSKYNGVDPKDVIDEYGIDTTRLFLLFSASPKAHCEWNTERELKYFLKYLSSFENFQ